MNKVTIAPASDLKLSQIILGFWRLQPIIASELVSLIKFAIDLGLTSIDEADIYGGYKSQQYFGEALKKEPSLRSKIEIISKTGIVLSSSGLSKSGIGYYDTSEAHIMQSVEQTLTDLNTDYLDLLLIHRPDPLMNPETIDAAFQKLKKAGKVTNFGVSNFTASQFEMLQNNMETALITNQIEFSVLHTSPIYDGTLDNALMHQIKPMIWSPLAGGAIFTKENEQVHEVRKVMQQISGELGGIPLDQLALAWILKHPSNALPVIGTFKKERIQSAVDALKVELTAEQWFRILVASQGKPMP